MSTEGHVATVLLCRAPHNFIDLACMTALADALEVLDADENCRAVVLGAQGKSFCAGADFSAVYAGAGMADTPALYGQGMRLFRTRKPIVAALHGPAIGAGAGLALVADFRIACPASRFGVPFNRLGFHPGFGMSCTLPRLVGPQVAARLFSPASARRGPDAGTGPRRRTGAERGGAAPRAGFAQEIARPAHWPCSPREPRCAWGWQRRCKRNAREWEIQQPSSRHRTFWRWRCRGARRLPVFTGR